MTHALFQDTFIGSIAHLRPRCLHFGVRAMCHSSEGLPEAAVQFMSAARDLPSEHLALLLLSSIPSLQLVFLTTSGRRLERSGYWWFDNKAFRTSHAEDGYRTTTTTTTTTTSAPLVIELSEEQMYEASAREKMPLDINDD